MHGFAYVGVLVAAVIESEAVFVAASLAVATGHLNFWGVLVAGALGGSGGDQFFFYTFRGPFRHWIDRLPSLRRRRDSLVSHVRRHAIALAASCRFLPGLRIAIPIACAGAGVDPLLFSSVSLVTSFIWAASILVLVTSAGPAALRDIGMARNWALGASAIVVLLVFLALRRVTLESTGGEAR